MSTSNEPNNQSGHGDRIRPWSSFKYNDFVFLWAGGTSMMLAMRLRELIAAQWLFDETRSPVQLGILGVVKLLQLPAALYGGGLADVVDRKLLMAATQFVSFLSLILLTLAAASGSLAPWHIYVVTGVAGIVNQLGNPARPALLPRVVPRSHLTNAVTIQTSSMQGGQIVAPIVFGGVYEIFGVAPAFAVATAVAGISFLAPLAIRASGRPEGTLRRVTVSSLLEGFRFVKGHPILPGLYALDVGVTVVSFYRELFPYFAFELYGLGAAGTAGLNTANSIGGIVGSMLVFITEKAKYKGRIVLYATFAYAVMLFAFGLTPIYWLGLVIVAVLGGTDAVGMTMRQAIVQLTTPDRLIGRASSAHSFSAMGANHVGQAEVSFVSGAIGGAATLVLGGFVSVAVVLGVWYFIPGVWRYKYEPMTDPDEFVPEEFGTSVEKSSQ